MKNIPLNALIVVLTNPGKTQYLMNQLQGYFRGTFDYTVVICPTFFHNKTSDGFVDNDSRIFVIFSPQEKVEIWLKLSSYFFFQRTNTLIVLDDCAASKEVKGSTGQLVSLGFSDRHAGISVWILTQQITGISKTFRENVATIVLFYTPSAKTMKAIFWRLHLQALPRRVQDDWASKSKFSVNADTVFLNRMLSTMSCKCWRQLWRSLQTAWKPKIFLFYSLPTTFLIKG